MQTFFSSVFACAKAFRTSSGFSGRTIAKTRCALSCPWTSLTRIPGGGLSFFGACASETAGAAAASPAAFRNERRFRFFS